MIAWVSVAASLQGKRERNEDAVCIERVGARNASSVVMIGCDGVGSLPGSGETAAAVMEAALRAIRGYLRRRYGLGPFRPGEHMLLACCLRRLKLARGLQGASTLAAAVVPGRLKARRILTFAVGDTRIYFLDDRKGLIQVTTDDHDGQGSLTAFVTAAGRVVYRSLRRHTKLHRLRETPRAIAITTDGIHEQCRPAELEAFLRYCIKGGVRSPEGLGDLLATFLRHNISDNASLCLHYRT